MARKEASEAKARRAGPTRAGRASQQSIINAKACTLIKLLVVLSILVLLMANGTTWPLDLGLYGSYGMNGSIEYCRPDRPSIVIDPDKRTRKRTRLAAANVPVLLDVLYIFGGVPARNAPPSTRAVIPTLT